MKITKGKKLTVEDELILLGYDPDSKWVNSPIRDSAMSLRRRKDGTYYLLRLFNTADGTGEVPGNPIGCAKMNITPGQAVGWWLAYFMPKELHEVMQEMFNPKP